MGIFQDLYLHLKVRTRILLLSLCYSICIVLAVFAGKIFSVTISIVTILILVALGIFFSWLLYWSINDALQRIIGYLAKMADSDLSLTVSAKRNNEISAIIRAVAGVQTTMRDIITQISQSSELVAKTSRQLHANASHIAAGTEDVASQTNTVAVASEEMSATSGDIARNCQMAAEGAQGASLAASDGVQVVERTVAVMGQIAAKVQESAKTVESLGERSD